jgi:four helix bundle protein
VSFQMSVSSFQKEKMGQKRYQDLIVWQKAMELSKAIYQVTKSFPDDERFGLTSQLRRASVSVPSNIAEGQGRLTPGEFKQFLGTARGSVFEVETQIQLAADFGYVAQSEANRVIDQTSEVSRMLNGLIRSLQTDNRKPGTSNSPSGNRKLETGN